ncbi:MAG TPA: metalloregulator ArsR/SmtB family transcription factor [Tepidisphaeraceae bacterium]|nr:metalloregulator ArsR/SmtB family transcription factor [Tepidisphaeraceae bacterium]
MTKAQFHRISKALADPTRYQILSRIAREDELACVDLRCDLPITPATLSHHLKELSAAGLIDMRKSSKFIHLKLRDKVWKDYLAILARL